jgi:hypothetical protein
VCKLLETGNGFFGTFDSTTAAPSSSSKIIYINQFNLIFRFMENIFYYVFHEVCRFMNFLFLVAASDVEPDAFGAWVMM